MKQKRENEKKKKRKKEKKRKNQEKALRDNAEAWEKIVPSHEVIQIEETFKKK